MARNGAQAQKGPAGKLIPMAKTPPALQEGARVRVKAREASAEDRKTGRYFPHMAGLTGTIENAYEGDQYAVKVDNETMTPITAEVHKVASERMRAKVVNDLSEEARKHFTKEELDFPVHYVLLVDGADLEPVAGGSR